VVSADGVPLGESGWWTWGGAGRSISSGSIMGSDGPAESAGVPSTNAGGSPMAVTGLLSLMLQAAMGMVREGGPASGSVCDVAGAAIDNS